MKRVVVVFGCFWSCSAAAQTGQALIANPLLSPGKIKEVKRQIMEAGHQELSPKLAMPVGPGSGPGAPVEHFPSGGGIAVPALPGQSVPTEADTVRRALASLRVMAIVGNSALLASEPPQPYPSATGYPGGQFPNGGALGMPGGMPMQQGPTYGLPQSQPPQNPPQQVRRGSSSTVRHGALSYVEGFEVTAFIEGDTVRLVMASIPGKTVFQGQIQPALYSPVAHPQAAALEKSSSEYLNNNKPDSTSMGSSTNGTNGGVPGQAPVTPVPAQNPPLNSANPYAR